MMEARAKSKITRKKTRQKMEVLVSLRKIQERTPMADISDPGGYVKKNRIISKPEKPENYWGKKLQLLEEKEPKLKGQDLYEFNSSGSSVNIKKKKKQKLKPRRRRKQSPVSGQLKNSEGTLDMMKRILHKKDGSSVKSSSKSTIASNEGAMIKERVLYNQALRVNGDSFIFDKPPIFGLCSTPGNKRLNLVKPSYFDFESPVLSTTRASALNRNSGSISTPSSSVKEIAETDIHSDSNSLSPRHRNVTLRRRQHEKSNQEARNIKTNAADNVQNQSCSLNIEQDTGECHDFTNMNQGQSEYSWDRNVTLRRGKKRRDSLPPVTVPCSDSQTLEGCEDSTSPLAAAERDSLNSCLSSKDSKSGVYEDSCKRNVTLRRRKGKCPSNNSSANCVTESLMSQTCEKSSFVLMDPMPAIMKRKANCRTKGKLQLGKSNCVFTKACLEMSDFGGNEHACGSGNSLQSLRMSCSSQNDRDMTEKLDEEEPDSDSDAFILPTDDELERGHSRLKLPSGNSTVQNTTLAENTIVEEKRHDEQEDLVYYHENDSRKSMIPGKRHHRARNVLRLFQTGRLNFNNTSCLNYTRGKNFEPFVESVLKLQPELERTIALGTTGQLSKESRNITLRSTRFTSPYRPTEFLRARRTYANATNDTITSRRPSTFNSSLSETFNYRRNRKSELDATLKTFDSTIRVVSTTAHVATEFRAAYGIGDTTFDPFQPGESNDISVRATTAREVVLSRCCQTEPLPFLDLFNEETLPQCKKIGEGVYGEVFMYNNKETGRTVFKVIPIEGDLLVNDEPQKSFAEILSEVVISMELSNLRTRKNDCCDGFAELRRVWCVKGSYPDKLQELWEEYDVTKKSENDNPIVFDEDQLYIVLELAHGGQDLEAFVFQNAKQAISAFKQAAFSLAVAERALAFEHRDFHWGNILVSKTENQFVTYTVDGENYQVATEGIKVAIIDFTLSRMTYDGCSIFNDLSIDPGLFTSEGDYQFDIYRMMKEENQNKWEPFCPRSNVFWLHYMLDKLVTLVRYSHPKSKIHKQGVKTLREWESRALIHSSAASMALALFS